MYQIFFVLLIILSMPVFAETITTITPFYSPYNASQAYYGGDYVPHRRNGKNRSVFSDINDLERYAMNKNFYGDSDKARLERLETLAFGAVQDGDILTRYNNVRGAILTKPKHNYKTSLLRNISNYFGGQLTGFTPQINNSFPDDTYHQNIYPYPQYTYPSEFGTSSYTEFSSPRRKGYRINNHGIGTSSGVTLLD